MPVKGFDVVAKNIKAFGDGFIPHVNKTMRTVAKMLDEEVTKNASLDCHSLEDLRRLGHPYRQPPGPELHNPNWQIHKQSGKLLSMKSSGITPAEILGGNLKAQAWVTIDESEGSYVNYLIFGTSKMIPRDFMTESLNIVKEPALQYLHENLRDFVFAFKPIQ